MRGLIHIGLTILMAGASLPAFAQLPREPLAVRVVATEFVLQGKIDKLKELAADSHVVLSRAALSMPDLEADPPDLLILDTPRPADLSAVQRALGETLSDRRAPWIRVGGGPPAFGNLPEPVARRLIAYYANGGQQNLRPLFAYLRAWHDGKPTDSIAPPTELAETGYYHPAAPNPFERVEDYLAWGADRWAPSAPRVAFAIHRGALVDDQLRLIDALVARSEARGQAPMAFWMDDRDPEALTNALGPARSDVLVNLQHMQNGPARQAEFLALGIPVLTALTWREGDRTHWRASTSGITPRTAATMLTVPESWGMTDPLVIAAIENGEPAPLPEQLDTLLDKVDRLARLRHLPAPEKRLALMFWNHPDGEKNVAASNLNVPRSLAKLTSALREAGYAVPERGETELIETAQRLLGGYYRPETLDTLLADKLAISLPLDNYLGWLTELPEPSRRPLVERWGDPAAHWALRQIEGQPHFVILESSLYELTRVFLAPVLLLILAALAYAFLALGSFVMEAWQRRAGRYRSVLAAHQRVHGGTSDDLELWIMQRLEWLRVTSRSAPMLGLVATMIPMGPALLALTESDAKGIGENLVIAFSAVILALIASSIAFFVLTVRRRWLLQELRAIERMGEQN